jgi:hypothetical protein
MAMTNTETTGAGMKRQWPVAAALLAAILLAALWYSQRGETRPVLRSAALPASTTAPTAMPTGVETIATTPSGPDTASVSGQAGAGSALAMTGSTSMQLATRTALEASVLRDGALLMVQAKDYLEYRDFDRALATLQADPATSPANAARYRQAFDESLQALGAASRVRDLACGPVVCVVAFSANGHGPALRDWSASIHDHVGLPMQSTIHGVGKRGDGSRELRLLFTIDPAMPGAIMTSAS